ncbi:hypothetical protein [Streptomyces sp. NPDC029003]|uniref:hypothetical protein n=1 Tax=Streptomyces sp. NPDC029003 TaxID=3155125 RepID=UPI003411EB64
MAWRTDREKVLGQLDEIRRALEDPATGLSALYTTGDQGRQKVLEVVAQGTLGLREENRELRRRQERMLTDLAEARSSLETLSRRVEGISQPPLPAEPRLKAAGIPELDAPAIVEPGEQQTAVVEPRSPEAPETLIEASSLPDGKEAQVDLLGEVRTAHDQAGSAGGPVVPAAPEAKAPAREPAQSDQEDYRAHLGLLLSAASIASATLICHRETWDFIAEQTSRHTHFRLPEHIDDAEHGRIQTSLSGRSLLAVLTTMWQVTRGNEISGPGEADRDLATWALAAAVYRRTALAVERVTHLPEKENGPAFIVLDDRSTLTTGRETPGDAS